MTLFLAMSLLAASVHDFTMNSIDGKPQPLAAFKGKAVLIVNVASQCGYTPQYKGLEALYQKYKGQGLVVVGVPANNFGAQEPGSDAEIKTFCERNYKVSFPMMSKVSVKGSDMTPLYGMLTKTGGDVRWNFTKFLIGKDGQVVKRFEPNVEPDSADLMKAVEEAIK